MLNIPLTETIVDINGKKIPFHFRSESIGDNGVINQIFVQQDYEIQHWYQGNRLLEYQEKYSSPDQLTLIVDAGANIGASTVYFLNKFHNCFLFAIEPEKNNWAILEKNTSTYTNKKNFLGGINCRDSQLLIEDLGHSDWGFFTHESTSSQPDENSVPGISPYSILSHTDCLNKRPLIMKIDIEGGEKMLFESDTDWMKLFPLIIIELHDWMFPFSGYSDNFIHVLEKYRCFDIIPRGENIFLFNRTLLSNF